MCAGRVQASVFRPAWWLRGAHLQTLWGTLRRRAPLDLADERLELPDGDFVELCWTPPGAGPIVAVFHGLEGSIESNYARGLLAAIQSAGWRGVFMHFRGCGREMNRLPRSYHSGDTGDIRFLIDALRARHPRVPIAAVGFSLGGNALLKYLGESGADAPLQAAAAVSVPFLLADGADRLNRGASRIYQRHLIRRLRSKLQRKFAGQPRAGQPAFMQRLAALDSFWTFDDAVTAPLHGFAGVADYYARSSCRPFLTHIRTPTLILHSNDDPFMTPAAIPADDELADAVTLELAGAGGHVGFVSGTLPWRPAYFVEQRIPEFLRLFV